MRRSSGSDNLAHSLTDLMTSLMVIFILLLLVFLNNRASVNTVVLITSSVTMVKSWASLALKNLRKFRVYMGATVGLACVFLVIKGFEYAAKFEHGLYPSESTFMAIYFTLTGLHGLHIIGGIIVNCYLLGPGSKMWKTDPARFTNRVEIAGLYWHFVDLVWIFLFPVLYLL